VFNLSGSEIVVILLLALVVLGPEKLPDAIRRFGRTYGELKRMSSSFQEEMRSTIEEPMREMRETANLLRDQADFTRHTDEKPTSGNPMEAGVATAAVQTADVDDDDEPVVAAEFDDADDEFDHEFDDIEDDEFDDDEAIADDDGFDGLDDDEDDEFDDEFDEEPTLLGEFDDEGDEAATGEDVADENASERDDGGHSSA
jgi:sec-independent protein translocase protein TatB